MESKILVDTSILIALQICSKRTIRLFNKQKEQIAVSRITACEFIYGSKNKNEKIINKGFLEKLNIIEVNEKTSKYTYSLLDKYGFHMKLGISDALIASTAIIENLQLWTLNTKHFKKIRELKLFEA